MPTKVIIDCDPGNGVPATDIDDALALGLALAAPGLDLQAVTIVDGNAPRDVGYAAARTLLDVADAATIPVHTGASHALLEPPGPWHRRRAARHSPEVRELWEAVPRPDQHDPGHRHDAAAEIAARIAAAPGEITLVAIGPLTNVAQALTLHPGLAADVARIVIMGGAFNVPGYLQELNFGMDPEAARTVIASGAPITLVPLDVTSTTSLRLTDLDRLTSHDNAMAGYLARITEPWIRYVGQSRGIDGCRLHDPLALALLLDDDLVETEEQVVDVQLDGLSRGRPIGWRPGSLFLHAGLNVPDRAPIRVVTGVDNTRLVDLLIRTLTRS
ncbi:nucleoside hydrolase [Saccharopolyspora pogona]|uniref:nucleoside hydrolase n=1 Tax=Saccharopolyspora pogona TaxID=333966 RepID=UPI00168281E9|nr:nucleoside hydrolase [Saccharopolyspora pogona]